MNAIDSAYRSAIYTTSAHYHSPELVFKHDGIEFYGAAKMDIKPADLAGDLDLIINLSGYPMQLNSRRVLSRRGWEVLNEFFIEEKFPEELLIDWVDGEPLLARRGFWDKLLTLLKERKYKRVYVCCTGGHGRTGTALAILYGITQSKSPRESIEHVRRTICTQLIETASQENYVFTMITGRAPTRDESLELFRANHAATNASRTRITPTTPPLAPAIYRKCDVCGSLSNDTLTLETGHFCKACVRLAIASIKEHGDVRPKKIKKTLKRWAKTGRPCGLEETAHKTQTTVANPQSERGAQGGAQEAQDSEEFFGVCDYCGGLFSATRNHTNAHGHNICESCAAMNTRAGGATISGSKLSCDVCGETASHIRTLRLSDNTELWACDTCIESVLNDEVMGA